MNSESSLNSRYRGRAVEFFIGIFDSDKARISRKRCTMRTRYILHTRARARSRFCEPLVNLRSLFIEIYSPKHSARRRHRSRYGPREYQKRNFRRSLATPPIFVYIEAISYAYMFCKANSTTTSEIRYTNVVFLIRFFFQVAVFVTYHSE